MKYKNKIVTAFFLILLVSVGIITGLVTHDIKMQKIRTDLYYFNSKQNCIVPEEGLIRYKDEEKIPYLVVERLIKGPKNNKLVKMIPNGTKINNVERVDEVSVEVDFSQEYFKEGEERALITSYAVIKTLSGISGIRNVKITVCGNDILKPNGDRLDFMSGYDINLQTDANNGEARDVVLYFGDKTGNKLVKETRTINVRDQQPVEQYIINELIKGTSDSGHTAVLKPGTTLISVETVDNVCFVNFDESFIDKNAVNEESEKKAVYSVVNTLTELDTIARVQFLINGKKVENFGAMNLSDMFGRELSMIK